MSPFVCDVFQPTSCIQGSSIACVSASLLLMAGQHSVAHGRDPICSSADRHLDCVHILAPVYSAAVNTHVQVFECLFPCLSGKYLGSRISQLCGDSDILRSTPDCFRSRRSTLYSHLQCVKVLISPRLTSACRFPLHGK